MVEGDERSAFAKAEWFRTGGSFAIVFIRPTGY